MTNFKNKVALVTGASSGIGAATVRALASPDLAVAVHARRNRAGRSRAHLHKS